FQRPKTKDQRPVLSVLPTRPSAIRPAAAFTLTTSAWPALALAHARFVNWVRSGAARHGCLSIKNLTSVNPDLHTNLTKRGARFSQTVIDVCPKRVQRQLPLKMPLAAGNLGAIQTAADFHLDSLGAKS